MSYRGTPYQSGYGGHGSMPMPMQMPMPGVSNQPSSQPYPGSQHNPPYAAHKPPYPSTTQNPPYPVRSPASPYLASTSTATMSSEIDTAMKQLTDDLVNIISSAQNEDLEGLINNDDKLNELIMDSQITKDLKQKREEMTSFNKDQAVTNLSLKPELENLKETLANMSQRQNELRDNYVCLQSKLGNTTSIDAIFAILQAAAVEKESLSDEIKTNFYDGDITVDEFIKHFVEERKLYQLRKIKSEKMNMLIQNPTVSSGVTSVPRYPVSQTAGYHANQHMPPYPVRSAIPPHPAPHPHPIPHLTSNPPLPPRGYYGGYNMR